MNRQLLTAIMMFGFGVSEFAAAQSVCLPAPRLLTTMPMGGQTGSEFELTIGGEFIDGASELIFSHPAMTAKSTETTNKYIVTIADDCPSGIHEARVMTRLGLSAARVFTVGTLREVAQLEHSPTLKQALPLEVDSVCNATMPTRAVNHYSFAAKKDQRLIVDCAAQGIDSKLNPVVIVGDQDGNDLQVERRGGAIDFRVPEDGTYTVKVHDLTFNGGPHYFYRLAINEIADDAPVTRMASTRSVSSHSWPPFGLPHEAATIEQDQDVQSVTLPLDVAGSFFPAADVDTYQFTAKKGEVWWVEVASERLGRPTDAAVVIQQVTTEGTTESLIDVAELSDIPSPVKVSSNGYSYDGPPYHAGSPDVLGKLEIKQDGTYRLQVTDLFGGTRNDPANVYRLLIRKPQPDFSVVAWALHMNLRNGDRNALSKPIALRRGWTMPLEVVVVRRDGFDGKINLEMEGLPDGVTAAATTIPAGKSRGIVLVSADEGAPSGFANATIKASATIDDAAVTRTCAWASMRWPIRNARNEIPSPRLLSTLPVSVAPDEVAPITIAPRESKVWEASVGQTLTIPLVHLRRGEFSGKAINMKTFGAPLESFSFELPLDTDKSEAVIDLGKLKTPVGEYTIAFYGSAVAKHRHNVDAIALAETSHQLAQQLATELAAEEKRLAAQAASASEQSKADAQQSLTAVTAKKKAADVAVTAAVRKLAAAKTAANPKDIVDIIVSEPIKIRVKAAESK